MNKNEMFVTATRNKFRFPFRGQISVEDLWDLSVENLDSVYKTLNSQVKKAKEESLLNTKSREDEIIEMQIEIVKYIVSVKQDESAKKVAAKEKKARKWLTKSSNSSPATPQRRTSRSSSTPSGHHLASCPPRRLGR